MTQESRKAWRRVLAYSALLVLLATAGTSDATVLDGNELVGNQTTNCYFQCINNSWNWSAENFTLDTAATVEELVFIGTSLWDLGNMRVDWTIFAGGGAIPPPMSESLHNGYVFNPTVTDLGISPGCCASYDLYSFALDISDIALPAGDYWVTFHVESQNLIGWADTTDGDDVVASYTDGVWSPGIGGGVDSGRARAFQILGNVIQADVPEPTTLALMGLGLAGIGFRRRRIKQ